MDASPPAPTQTQSLVPVLHCEGLARLNDRFTHRGDNLKKVAATRGCGSRTRPDCRCHPSMGTRSSSFIHASANGFFFFATAYLISRDTFATQRNANLVPCSSLTSAYNCLCHPMEPSIIWVPAIYPSRPLSKLLRVSRHGFSKVSTYIVSGDIFIKTKTITTL
jgi:hypothetical protein